MIDPIQDRRPPLSPSLALRVAVLGVVAFVLFGIVFFRLWYLQVLSGDQYLAQANDNRVRVERVAAPRGAIVDRDGRVLVRNRRANVVAIEPDKLPQEVRDQAAEWGRLAGLRERRPKGRKGDPIPIPQLLDGRTKTLYRRLGRVIRMPWQDIHQRVVEQLVQVPYAPITVKTDILDSERNYIAERQDDFPGVRAEHKYLRTYPQGQLAAQVFGTIGEITEDQLDDEHFDGAPQGTVVGQSGLEYEYDTYLRGRDGSTRIIVDANGNPKGTRPGRDPTPGRQLRLTIDLGLQSTMQQALARGGGGRPSAAVALDPSTGEVLAMASLPTFDPEVLARPITQEKYDSLFGDPETSPLTNRATTGLYATGSTFKPVTALAALAAGKTTPLAQINDTGCITIGKGVGGERCNAKKQVYGAVDLRRAMTVSSDIYFYVMGQRLNAVADEPLQTWARRLGYGRRTGIDLPVGAKGLVPDAEWREDANRREADCRKDNDGKPCGIADGTNRPWLEGDEVNLAIGQGDLQATPLQVALSYAAIANGGRVPKPHLAQRVEDEQGRVLQRIDPGTARRFRLPEEWRAAIMDGLKGAASAPGGTSTGVFQGWDHDRFPVYGKTGTVQRTGQNDSSWYVAYAHQATPEGKRLRPIVVAALVEGGGFGAASAAPAVKQVLSKWFTGKAGEFTPGSSTDT
ncbi:penicillin-binding transpeptidase domain-containing protein [Conexibacter sp. SYSU D00693]|uniref:penicillin-binding transpeptidase domain-containing protein n=1 Tax=Conexibacter sp. SYSU D00693 TaxID=2812560 RepID=UPI00196A895A|nr:penicillin-binding transpeptidase domain-containing protein [Conexibacter sp. SYSU D00693]